MTSSISKRLMCVCARSVLGPDPVSAVRDVIEGNGSWGTYGNPF